MFLDNVFSVLGILNGGVLRGLILEPILLLYVKIDLPQAWSETGSYLYPGNACISYKYKNFQKIEATVNKEFSAPCNGFFNKNFFH